MLRVKGLSDPVQFIIRARELNEAKNKSDLLTKQVGVENNSLILVFSFFFLSPPSLPFLIGVVLSRTTPQQEIPSTGLQLTHEIVNEQSVSDRFRSINPVNVCLLFSPVLIRFSSSSCSSSFIFSLLTPLLSLLQLLLPYHFATPDNVASQDQPSSGEQFVAFHRDVTRGAKEELSPTLLGVNNMAMKFLPANYKLLSVITVYREIVAGVKYELLVNAIQENGERTVCHLQILERPWIVNQWGEKWRQLQFSNCTGGGDPVATPPTDTYHVNPVFNPNPQPMTEERIRELENQILRANKKRVENPAVHQGGVNPGEEDDSPPAALGNGVREELDKFFSTQQMATRQQVAANEANPVTQQSPLSEIPPSGTNNEDLNRMHYSTSSQLDLDSNKATVAQQEVEKQSEIAVGSNSNNIGQVEDEAEENVQQIMVPVFENVQQQQQQADLEVIDKDRQQSQQPEAISATSSRRRRSIEAGVVRHQEVIKEDNLV